MAAKKIKPQTTAEKLDAIGEEVIGARIANCEFISAIAKSYGVSLTRFHAWLDSKPEMYARARERQADKLAEDLLQIADDGLNDTYLDDEGNKRTDQDVIARSRLRVDARKWLASKMAPKRYGEKLAIDAEVKVSDATDEQLNARLTELIGKAGIAGLAGRKREKE